MTRTDEVQTEVTFSADLSIVDMEYIESNDSSRRNLFKLTSYNKPYGEESIDQLYNSLSEMLDKESPFVALYDFRDYASPSLSMAYQLGSKCKDLGPRFNKNLKASVVVLDGGFLSSIMANLITVFNSIVPPECPTTTVYTMEDAIAFLDEHWYEQS
eukprot:GEMP01036100.1.p1 GENE.GEMP01036100.1~~GEMP01036100.1.p1  ORF type:complete len:157 (+),score=26.61 GEMP01036100.1:112-582(+)